MWAFEFVFEADPVLFPLFLLTFLLASIPLLNKSSGLRPLSLTVLRFSEVFQIHFGNPETFILYEPEPFFHLTLVLVVIQHLFSIKIEIIARDYKPSLMLFFVQYNFFVLYCFCIYNIMNDKLFILLWPSPLTVFPC